MEEDNRCGAGSLKGSPGEERFAFSSLTLSPAENILGQDYQRTTPLLLSFFVSKESPANAPEPAKACFLITLTMGQECFLHMTYGHACITSRGTINARFTPLSRRGN